MLQDFAAFDINRSGVLEKVEIYHLLKRHLGNPPTEAQVAAFLGTADTDQDQCVATNLT